MLINNNYINNLVYVVCRSWQQKDQEDNGKTINLIPYLQGELVAITATIIIMHAYSNPTNW